MRTAWPTTRAKFLFAEKDERGYPDEPLLAATQDRGVVLRSDLDYRVWNPGETTSAYKLAKPGDFVISLRSFQGGIEVVHDRGLVSPAYITLRPTGQITGYYRWFFKSEPFIGELASRSTGIRQGKSIRADQFLDMPIPTPPLDEQLRIADFLDIETARIDALIVAKTALSGLLAERFVVSVQHVVNESSEPQRDEWTAGKIKFYAAIRRGRFSHRPRNDPRLYGGEYPFVQTGDVARAGRLLTAHSQTLNEAGLATSRMFPAGTVAMAIAANIGDVTELAYPACFPDSVVGFEPGDRVSSGWLYYALLASRDLLLRDATLNTQLNTNLARLGEHEIAVPPAEEQRRIVQRLDRLGEAVQRIVQRIEWQVSLLSEYRQALITAAVTGQLDEVMLNGSRRPVDDVSVEVPG